MKMEFRDMDELAFLWKEYGKEKDSRLCKDAIALKKKVRDFVKSLPTFQEDEQHQEIIKTRKEVLKMVADGKSIEVDGD